MRARALLAAVATVVAMGCLTGGIGTEARGAAAASHPMYELSPVAGSARYLIYTRFPFGATEHDETARGGLFVLRKDGVTRRIDTISNWTSIYGLGESTLIYYQKLHRTGGGQFLWTDLKTGKSGRLKHNPAILAAAPHGYVTYKTHGTDPAEYLYHRIGGSTVSLGRPFHDPHPLSTDYGGHHLVIRSVTADEYANGKLRAMSFRHPGVWRTLIPRLVNGYNEDYNCRSVTEKYVACLTLNDLGTGDELRLIPLDGSAQSITDEECASGAYYPAVMGDSLTWAGCHGYFTVLRPDGKIEISRHRYLDQAVPAFGQLVVTTMHQQRLLLVSSAHGTPKVLVRTK